MSDDDESTAQANAMLEVMEGMSRIREAVVGYRAQLQADGFSPTAAEVMAMELHNAMMRKAWA